MSESDFYCSLSKPRMPGELDAIFEEVALHEDYRAVAFDSDPFTNVTVLKGDSPLFTALVADHTQSLPYIAANIDALAQELETD